VSRRLTLLGTTLLLAIGSRLSAAQANSTMAVNPATVGTIAISAAVAGQQPTAVVASGGSYDLSLKKNGGLYTITARLAAPLPPGASLSVSLASPGSGAQSLGSVVLTTTAQPVVTSLTTNKFTSTGSAVTYSFSSTSAVGVFTQTVDVIFALAP
jgi:hypothetical protein